MKKPEKKFCATCKGTKVCRDAFGEHIDCPHCHLTHQYNQCWDEREKWLKGAVPSVLDITNIIKDGLLPCDQSRGTVYKLWSPEGSAKAIHSLITEALEVE